MRAQLAELRMGLGGPRNMPHGHSPWHPPSDLRILVHEMIQAREQA